jgi:Peptidase A4 family
MCNRWRRVSILTIVVVGLVAAPAHAFSTTQTSTNWAGYVTSSPGLTFRHVSATWTMPAATCPAGTRSYEATWVGIGGYHTTSQALEQIGTESDCSKTGTPVYSAWYEIVPSASATIRIPIKPGDVMSASVHVTGHTVRMRLTNVTRAISFTKTLHAARVDTTSADWIVEAPSSCNTRTCVALPLANFGTETFNNVSTTTTDGVTGTVVNPLWTTNAISLSTSGSRGPDLHGPASTLAPTQALVGNLTDAGDSFTVTYGDTTTTTPPDIAPPVETTPGQ